MIEQKQWPLCILIAVVFLLSLVTVLCMCMCICVHVCLCLVEMLGSSKACLHEFGELHNVKRPLRTTLLILFLLVKSDSETFHDSIVDCLAVKGVFFTEKAGIKPNQIFLMTLRMISEPHWIINVNFLFSSCSRKKSRPVVASKAFP